MLRVFPLPVFGISACAGALLMASAVKAQSVLPRGELAWGEAGLEGIRGITIGPIESSLQPNRGYGSPLSDALLDELVRLGANWISITPFGRLWALDETEILMDFEAPFDQNRESVKRMVDQAHARGIQVLIIPHLWVETGGWRGEVGFEAEEDWAAYHESYRSFVLEWATVAGESGADAFSIGVECKSWSGRFGDVWTGLIRDVRSRFDGVLTYSANWDEAESVIFWEQLDLIGINAFYPLADENGATDEEYRRRANNLVEGVHSLAQTFDMPLAFVEIGYTTRANAAVEPWLWPDGMTDVVIDEREQARALSAMFDAFLPEPWFAGFFLWRYYTNIDDVTQEATWGFSPHAKLAEPVIHEAFTVAWGVDPDPWPWILRQPKTPNRGSVYALPIW